MLFLPGVMQPDQQGAVIATHLSTYKTYKQFTEPAMANELTTLYILIDLQLSVLNSL